MNNIENSLYYLSDEVTKLQEKITQQDKELQEIKELLGHLPAKNILEYDVSNMTPQEAEEFIKKLREKFKEKHKRLQ